jgi:hypothetical protein
VPTEDNVDEVHLEGFSISGESLPPKLAEPITRCWVLHETGRLAQMLSSQVTEAVLVAATATHSSLGVH